MLEVAAFGTRGAKSARGISLLEAGEISGGRLLDEGAKLGLVGEATFAFATRFAGVFEVNTGV